MNSAPHEGSSTDKSLKPRPLKARGELRELCPEKATNQLGGEKTYPQSHGPLVRASVSPV